MVRQGRWHTASSSPPNTVNHNYLLVLDVFQTRNSSKEFGLEILSEGPGRSLLSAQPKPQRKVCKVRWLLNTFYDLHTGYPEMGHIVTFLFRGSALNLLPGTFKE